MPGPYRDSGRLPSRSRRGTLAIRAGHARPLRRLTAAEVDALEVLRRARGPAELLADELAQRLRAGRLAVVEHELARSALEVAQPAEYLAAIGVGREAVERDDLA